MMEHVPATVKSPNHITLTKTCRETQLFPATLAIPFKKATTIEIHEGKYRDACA
jgi:hypothetical protein